MPRCGKCGLRNKKTANFCSTCGIPIPRDGDAAQAGRAGRAQRNRIAVLGFLAAMAAVLSLWRLSPGPHDSEKPEPFSSGEMELIHSEPAVEAAPARLLAPVETLRPVVGEVILLHHAGLELARLTTAVVSGRWIALPVHACYGGDLWRFSSRVGSFFNVTSGSWRDGETVALWLLEEGVSMSGPELKPWRSNLPVSWRSIVSSDTRPEMILHAETGLTRFASTHGDVPQEPGLYLQDGHVVGWTFGPLLESGVLWAGPPGAELTEDIRVDHFYHLTFANGREEQFIHALSMPENSSTLERLRAFSKGFQLRPELPSNQTPAILRRERMAFLMRGLANALDEKGFSREVSDLLPLEVLLAASDAELAVRSLMATSSYYGTSVALDRAEEFLNASSVQGDASAVLIREFSRGLFTGWISDRINQADTLGARHALKRAEALFPEDPEIGLLAVELALSDKDWRTAEEVLRFKEVPQELSEWAVRSTRRIERLRMEEQKVVIRFQPGQRNISVEATLNNSLTQAFLIDTGASVVTIPSGTAEKLGISVDQNTPVHWVSTAGGPVEAKEVVLDVIELHGRRIKNVTAFVLDIPGRSDIGLLGLNYLDHFFVEIDNEQGVLMLTPR